VEGVGEPASLNKKAVPEDILVKFEL